MLIVVHCLKLGLNLGVINIEIYGKKVRCSFNSFEQCSLPNMYCKMILLSDTTHVNSGIK